MKTFTYTGLPARVIFGAGTILRIAEEADRLGIRRAMVLTTPAQFAEGGHIMGLLGGAGAVLHTRAAMHTPIEVTQAALEIADSEQIDGLIAVGGGSTTGLSKAIAHRTDLPQIIVPTTYAGSEVTPILGETHNGIKTTISDPTILPEVVIYDVELTLSLPLAMTVASGMNALAHAVEALYAREANPVLSLMAQEGIRALSKALREIVNDVTNRDARADALYGSWLCGMCLGSAGMSLHHKLCHTVGGSFDLPHAETHSAILPHALAYNASAVPEVDKLVASALGSRRGAAGLHELAVAIGAPTSLQAIGFRFEDIERAADLAMAKPYWNPRPLERPELLTLLNNAFAGNAPETIND